MMRVISYFIILCLLVLGVTFALLNSEMITLHYYLGTRQMPLSIALLISAGIGILFCFITMGMAMLRLKWQLRHLRKQLRIAEVEIKNLREIPLKDAE